MALTPPAGKEQGLQEKLEQIGFKKNEAAVYVAVLELGEPMVGDVETQTGMHKQLIYNAAEHLLAEGLIEIAEIRGRKHFRATDPTLVEERLRQKTVLAHNVVSELLSAANKKRIADEVRVYRGKQNVQQYFLQSMRKQPEGSTLYVLGMESERYFQVMNRQEFPFEKFERTRVERKVKMQLVLFGNSAKEQELNIDRSRFALRLLAEPIATPFDFDIWHDHVGMLFYAEEPYVLDIMGQETVKGFQEYFRVLWNIAGNKKEEVVLPTEVTEGID